MRIVIKRGRKCWIATCPDIVVSPIGTGDTKLLALAHLTLQLVHDKCAKDVDTTNLSVNRSNWEGVDGSSNPMASPLRPEKSDLYKEAELRDDYWAEIARLNFAEKLLERMKTLGMSARELDKRLKVYRGFTSKLISGKHEFTIATMARLAKALDSELKCHIWTRQW